MFDKRKRLGLFASAAILLTVLSGFFILKAFPPASVFLPETSETKEATELKENHSPDNNLEKKKQPIALGVISNAFNARNFQPIPAQDGMTSVIKAVDDNDNQWRGYHDAGIRSRAVRLNGAMLRGGVIAPNTKLSLPLFDDVTVDAVVSDSFRNINGTISTTAKIEGSEYGRVFIASTDSEVHARIRDVESGKLYAIQYNHDTGEHYSLELDIALAEPENSIGSPHPVPPAEALAADAAYMDAKLAGNPPPIEGDENTNYFAVVDIMVVYTDDALAAAGSQAAMDNKIALGIAFANDAHNNTGSYIVWYLVHSYEVTYAETGNNSTDLDWVTADAGVASERDAYGADFVCFMNNTGSGGVGWKPNNLNGSPSYAFSVTDDDSFASYTPAHEVGHNMSLSHTSDQNVQPGPTTWNPDTYGWGNSTAGWHWHPDGDHDVNGWCSVMTYTSASYFDNHAGSHTRVGLFSDPNIMDNGQPAGSFTDGYNAQVLRQLRHVYAAYRDRLSGTQILVDYPNGGETLTEGSTYSILWDSAGVAGNVKIELYKDGSPDSVIETNAINDRTYAWTVPVGKRGLGYTIRISDLDSGSIADTSDATFAVDAPPIYYEDFDVEGSIPANMTQTQMSGSLSWIITSGGQNGFPSSAHSGTQNARLSTLTADAGYASRLITPAFSTVNYTNITLTFWHAQAYWPDDQDELRVLYSTNGGASWATLATYTAEVPSWTQRTLSLPVASTNTCVAFEGTANAGYGVCVDDIVVDGDLAGSSAGVSIIESGGSTDVSEDGVTDTYTVVLTSQPTADVMITITGDAQVNVSAASLTFTDANWDSPQTVTVSAVDDSNDEGMHTGTITHSAGSADANYHGISISSVTVTITDNDTRGDLGFASASYSVAEDGGSVRVYVTRTGGSNDAVSVDYATTDGTAVAGTDFTTASGTLNWGDGSMITNHFDVSITDNSLYTGDRAFAVRLSNPTGGVGLALTNATVTILEDEVLPSVPEGLVATPSMGQVDLSWAAASEATGYKVKRATSPGGPFDTTLGTSVTTNYSDTSASDGMIYYYVVAATNPAGESVISGVASATLPNVVPFVEDFEAPVSAGVLAGQRLWVASNAVVEAGVGVDGSQGLNLGTGTAQQTFSNGSNTVTVSVWCKPVPGEEPAAVAPDAASVFWVDTNLNVRVYSNHTAVTLPAQIDTNAWTHFEIGIDYAAGTWQLRVDGGAVISGLGLYSNRTNFTTIRFENTTDKPFYIDDISIASAAAPPTAYETWLADYGFTTEDDSLLSSNGVNTIREAYIAGIDPTNAASVFAVTSIGNESGAVITWGVVSGRLYNVYWSSNLLGGAASFQLLQSNIPWTVNSITDTVHNAVDSGFYRIDVQLE